MHMHMTRAVAGLFLGALALAACGKKEDTRTADSAALATPPALPSPSVSAIETGKHLGMNRRVSDTTSTFAPRDTVYLVVVTDNALTTSMLTAKWTFQTGQLVDSTAQAVAPAEAAGTMSVTEFHLVKPSGWPVGVYTVDVMLDGRSVGTRQVTVKR